MLNSILKQINPADESSMQSAKKRLDQLAKLPGSLGELETAIIRLAGLQQTDRPDIRKKTSVVFCADNGVVSEGVTPSDTSVTAAQAVNFVRGGGVVNAFARRVGADVMVVDVGIATEYSEPKVLCRRIRPGTDNIAQGPAMTRSECIAAIEAGIDTAVTLHNKGSRLLVAGEMGIGNTTTASAVTSVLLRQPPEAVTGRGAGTAERIAYKASVIRRAIEINNPDPDDPIDILSKVGGLDIAAMCGLYLGGAATRTAVMMDGLISSAAALCACRLMPDARCAVFPSHCTTETAGPLLLKELGFRPLISAGLCLGEGTGGLLGAQLIDDALAAYYEVINLDSL